MLILKRINWKYCLFLLFFLPILVLAIVFFKARSKQVSKLKVQYVEISFDKNDSGIIESVRPLIPRSHISLVRLSNNHFLQLPWAENWNLYPKYLVQFIQEGDSVCKLEQSDSLFIYRCKRKYVFCLNHRIY